MRKIVQIIALMLVIILAAGAVGCGEPKRPEYISDRLFQYGSKAIEVIDDYLDRKIDQKEAQEELRRLDSRGWDIREHDHEEGTIEHTWDVLITTEVEQIKDFSFKYSTRPEILEERNDLAERIGVKPRK